MKKRIIFLILISTLIFNLFPQFDFAIRKVNAKTTQEEIDDINKQIVERKKKIQELEKSIETYKQSVKQKQLETASLNNQLSILDNHIARIQTDVELTNEKIKKTQLEIDTLKLSIDEKEKIIDRQKKIISRMIRDINKEQNKGYLETLLTNSSLSDFFNQIQYAESVYRDLSRTVKSLRITKEDLQGKKQSSEKYKKEQEDLKNKLILQKDDYQEQSDYKMDILTQTKWSESKYKTLLSNLKSQYQQIENEVVSYEREVQKKLAAQNKVPDSGNLIMSWPTTGRYITAYFHDPEYPFRYVFEHSGIDIAASQGTPVKAAASGYVARARYCSSASCYSYILLVHTSNLSTLYGHLSSISVQADQFVNKGDVIGYTGGTPGTVGAGPFVTGPHIHFETRLNGIPVDPLGYLSK